MIPTIGTRLKLLEDWPFQLHVEHRNAALRREARLKRDNTQVTLPKGTILKVDRIYLRQQGKDYESISYYIDYCPKKTLKSRFWAKLADINRHQVCEYDPQTVPGGTGTVPWGTPELAVGDFVTVPGEKTKHGTGKVTRLGKKAHVEYASGFTSTCGPAHCAVSTERKYANCVAKIQRKMTAVIEGQGQALAHLEQLLPELQAIHQRIRGTNATYTFGLANDPRRAQYEADHAKEYALRAEAEGLLTGLLWVKTAGKATDPDAIDRMIQLGQKSWVRVSEPYPTIS